MDSNRMSQERKELEQKVVDLIDQVYRMSREVEATARKSNLDKQDNFHLKCILSGLKHAQWSAKDWVDYIHTLNDNEVSNP